MRVVNPIPDRINLKPIGGHSSKISITNQIPQGQPQQHSRPKNQRLPHGLIGILPTQPPLHIPNKISHIIGHLRRRRRSPIIIVDHSILELPGHPNDHMIKVGIIALPLGNVHSLRRLIMIPSHNVIDIIHRPWSITNLREISRPDSSIGIFGLVL